MAARWEHLHKVQLPLVEGARVSLLIGMNALTVHWVLEHRYGGREDPYAIRTLLGWALFGLILGRNQPQANKDFVKESGPIIKRMEAMRGLEFGKPKPLGKTHSVEDKRVFTTLESHTYLTDGHLEVPLPWTEGCLS
ncbi:hypothetical protein D915_008842 [Fasciola hepatica]|uniref:Uncharacterized protein n=1 Tax=Fasciola hepatica TaxID=6192 RepID=A0A4E0QZA9_FASHE|nr:hypothetical protein D915_008842 [Fasciola hepatica]